MLRTKPALRCGLAAILFVAASTDAQRVVSRIEVHCHWGGLGIPQDSDLPLDANAANAAATANLVAALDQPPIPRPDLQNLEITPAWLKEVASGAALKLDSRFADAASNQKDIFVRAFNNAEIIDRVVRSLFQFVRFDDYPSAAVKVTFSDGSTLSAESNSYYPFMLPWRLEGRSGVTYNANISRAIAALMQPETLNRDRLTGDDLDAKIAGHVMAEIRGDWHLLDAENRAAATLATLRTSYQVQSAEIHGSHHPEYGLEWRGGAPQETNLHASLRKPSMPSNMTDALVLLYQDGKVQGVEGFMGSAARYESLPFSIPWLASYIRRHPQIEARVSYVHDASFGDQAMRVFADDMHRIGRDEVVSEVRARRSEITLLITGAVYGESYWLVFPDKRVMLWRSGGPSGLLKWTPEDFRTRSCSRYQGVEGGCVGAFVAPDGTLVPTREPENPEQACLAAGRHDESESTTSSDVLFPVRDGRKAGFIDRRGNIVMPLCFDSMEEFSEGLAPFERHERWGFIDRSGRVAISPRFTSVWGFSEGLARVKIDDHWGFIYKSGRVAIEPKYRGLDGVSREEQGFRGGLAMVDVAGKIGFIDKSGRMVIKPQFAYAHHFHEGLAAVYKTGYESTWGYIDVSGKWIIPPQLESASSFSEGLAPINRSHDCGYIDHSGTIVLRPPQPNPPPDCAAVWGSFNEGLSRWLFGDKYGYIDKTGKTIIEPRFDRTFEFSEGLAAVMVGKKWGYIDITGRMVIEPRALNDAGAFHNGLARVVTPDYKHGYIDRSGKYVWEPTSHRYD